jgi:hypothetical protein
MSIVSESRQDRAVHVWPRALVWAGLLSSTLVASYLTVVQGNGPLWWVAWWLPVLLAAIPLGVAHREPFRVACLVSAVLIIVLAVLGFWLEMFVHLPTALILLAASAADPRRAPRRALVAVVIGGSVAALATTLFVTAWANS